MAITNLKVNTSRMDGDVQQLTTRLKQAREHAARIKTAMDTLNSMWEGAASKEKKQRFEAEYDNICRLCDLVGQMIDELSNARKEYETCENQVMDAVNGLSV